MTSRAQLEAVHAAAEIVEKRLGHIYEAVELLVADIGSAGDLVVKAQAEEWRAVLRWLSGNIMGEEERLYRALRHDVLEAARAAQ